MAGLTYTLAWPRPLFDWEAARVAALGDDIAVSAIELLLTEAIVDEGIVDDMREAVAAETRDSWTVTPPDSARDWLADIRRDDARLGVIRPPVYFAEREGFVDGDAPQWPLPLVHVFAELINDMQDRGYFPLALPRWCPDDQTDYEDVTRRLRRATKLGINWPLGTVAESTIFTLIEYFHDQAQRPRVVERIHDYAGCGPHFGRHNRESGGVVYRWRMNELLAAHDAGYRLGSTGEEKGRLIRTFQSPIGEVADRQIQQRQVSAEDEVAHAIREFRKRDAGLPEKRSAIRALSHALEPRRKEIAARLSRKDEGDLFQIVNSFTIRHNKDTDRDDYGDEFLDWIFWTHLATVDLLDQLDARDEKAS